MANPSKNVTIQTRPRIALIAAMAANRVIGYGNKMPWHLPADLRHFKQLTMAKPLIMGRKTFESIGSKPLPMRVNIVVSRDPAFQPAGVVIARDLQEALKLAEGHAAEEIMIMGGASIYEQALPIADRLYLTFIQLNVPGDAYFPDLAKYRWTELSSESHTPDPENPYNYSFVTYERYVGPAKETKSVKVEKGWKIV